MAESVIPHLKSRFWVEALLRRSQGEGKYGAVVKTGVDEAGAVYVAINHLDGTYDLLEPPPGSSYDEDGERIFAKTFEKPVPWAALQLLFDRRRKSDSDLWLVEIEDRSGLAGLQVK